MNLTYLNEMSEKSDGKFVQKVGFSGNWDSRRRSYITDNPFVIFKEYAKTYDKTKHFLERQCQKEIEEMGGEFIVRDGIKTEWFKIDKPISLSDLKCCKNRKIYKFEN